jgi:hypothetical protein
MFWRMIILTVFVLSIANAGQTHAEDGWSWNPFSKSKEAAESTPKSKSSWMPSMPKMTMPFTSKSSTTKKKPSAYSKMSRATKNWWNKTTELLDPYPDEPTTSPSWSSQKESSDGWMAGWFKSKPKKEYEDANDWLRQPRP